MGAAATYMGWVEIIRIKANSVRLALNLPTGTGLGNMKIVEICVCIVCMDFCQAQFQLASSVLVELRLAILSLSDHHIAWATLPPHSLRNPPHSLHNLDPDKFTSSLIQLTMYWKLSEWTSYEI